MLKISPLVAVLSVSVFLMGMSSISPLSGSYLKVERTKCESLASIASNSAELFRRGMSVEKIAEILKTREALTAAKWGIERLSLSEKEINKLYLYGCRSKNSI